MVNLDLFTELLETSATACEKFLKSEIALNDADVELCQKYSKDGQQLIKSLINDTFQEIAEEYGFSSCEVLDYDYPNNMELIVALNSIYISIGALISCQDEKLKDLYLKKLEKSINTVKEIYLALFEN